jgi:hypothetical protein
MIEIDNNWPELFLLNTYSNNDWLVSSIITPLNTNSMVKNADKTDNTIVKIRLNNLLLKIYIIYTSFKSLTYLNYNIESDK